MKNFSTIDKAIHEFITRLAPYKKWLENRGYTMATKVDDVKSNITKVELIEWNAKIDFAVKILGLDSEKEQECYKAAGVFRITN